MRWRELMGLGSKDQRDAIKLAEHECWQVDPTRDPACFFKALANLAPAGAVLYLEESTERRVPELLEPLQIADPTPVATGTIWPASDRYHVLATSDSLGALAALIDEHSIALPVIHTHLYRGRQVLVEWYDAFTDDPIYISATLPEPTVKQFAETIGTQYRWSQHAA